MLLWVYIHTGQAWKISLTTVGIEPTTLGILAFYSQECNFREGLDYGRRLWHLKNNCQYPHPRHKGHLSKVPVLDSELHVFYLER
jgi:hypothetical protein